MEQSHLEEFTRRLRLPRRRKHAIARELASHLAEARHDLVLSGWKPEDAGREALARLGEPAALVDAFESVHRPSRRARTGLVLALAVGTLFGVYGIGGSFASATVVRPKQPPHITRTAPPRLPQPGRQARPSHTG